MKFAQKLAHYFFPRESNNQKAKLLHPSSLFLVVLFLLFYQLFLEFTPKVAPSILGYAANISPSEVIRLTNEKRAAHGLPALVENPVLSSAAQTKGGDMLAHGYWAHVAPDGTEPWKFFLNAGYKYRYAGENLARDFSNPASAVEAWMASPSHRENMLSDRYKEIGIAVVEGNLAGVDTTIIVQFFGTKYTDMLPSTLAQAKETASAASTASVAAVANITLQPTLRPLEFVKTVSAGESANVVTGSKNISPFYSTRTISMAVVAVFLIVIAIDGIVVYRRKVARVAGRNMAHLAFLMMILLIVLILKSGQIL